MRLCIISALIRVFFVLIFKGVHYFLNIDRCAYGGVIHVSSFLDNTPQVRGAEVLAVNSECTQVYYHDDGIWQPYISARNIRCQPACT